MHIDQILDFLLESGQEVDDQMEVLETQPLPLLCCLSQSIQYKLVLVTPQGDLSVILSSNRCVGVFLQLLGRIKPRGYYKESCNTVADKLVCQFGEVEDHPAEGFQLEHSLAKGGQSRN